MRLYGWFFLIFISPQVVAVDVIVNRTVPGSSIAQASARAYFGMRLSKWPDGRPIQVFVLPDGHPTHTALCKEQLNLYPYQLRQSWDRLVYSGLAQAPIEVLTEDEMISRVATTPGALGYVRKVRPNEPVKILNVVE